MIARRLVKRIAMLTCTTLGCWGLAAPAMAQVEPEGIPTGAPPSPLLNGATAWSQKLMVYEEIGTKPLAVAATPATLPVPAICTTSPTSGALDTFLKKPLWPAPREYANDEGQNPWLSRINQCLGYGLTKSPIEGRPPGEYFAHQRYQEFYPKAFVQTVTAGARNNTGLRDPEQRHQFAAGTEFGPGGLYYNAAVGPTNAGTKIRLHPKLPVQGASSVWTFDGTFPPKLIMARYDQPLLLRHFNALPILGDQGPISLSIDGAVSVPNDARATAVVTRASHDLDRTLRLQMLAGGWWRDAEAGVAVVSNEAARRYFGGIERAIGRRVSLTQGEQVVEARVVGVVSDVAHPGRTQLPPPRVWIPLDGQTRRYTYLLRADNPAALASNVRAVVATHAAAVPMEYLQTFDEALAQAASSDYTVIGLLAGFAGLALLLASTGLFGVVSYTAAQRTAEFGTRIALGARAIDVVYLVARSSAILLAIGLSIGLAGGISVGFMMKGMLYGLSPMDPLSLGTVIALLSLVTITATAIPAWRAARIDPAIALRAE